MDLYPIDRAHFTICTHGCSITALWQELETEKPESVITSLGNPGPFLVYVDNAELSAPFHMAAGTSFCILLFEGSSPCGYGAYLSTK